jgi:hypothetical protein
MTQSIREWHRVIGNDTGLLGMTRKRHIKKGQRFPPSREWHRVIVNDTGLSWITHKGHRSDSLVIPAKAGISLLT